MLTDHDVATGLHSNKQLSVLPFFEPFPNIRLDRVTESGGGWAGHGWEVGDADHPSRDPGASLCGVSSTRFRGQALEEVTW